MQYSSGRLRPPAPRSRSSLVCFASAVLVTWVVSGCDGQPPPLPLQDGGRRDGGHDAAVSPDSGPPADGAVPDSGFVVPRDAGPPSCTLAPGDVHKLASDRAGDRIVGLAATGDGFGLVFTAVPEGGAIAEVYGVRLSSAGMVGALHPITAPPGRKNPPTVGAVGTSWVAGWVDNAMGTFEVSARALAEDLSPAGASAAYLTATPTIGETGPVFFVGSEGPLLAWIADDGTTRAVHAQRVGADGAPIGASAIASSAHRPAAIALGELAGGPALAYPAPEITAGGPETRVYVQGLMDDGAARGVPARIDEEGNADGTIDAALSPSGGAIVFGALVGGVGRQVRFRRVDGDGARVGDERILASGSDASIAAFAGGYAVSYRASAAPAEIRLLLVSDLGEVLDELPIAAAEPSGGRTTLRVSGDGQIAIAWADTDVETAIQVARVACGGGT